MATRTSHSLSVVDAPWPLYPPFRYAPAQCIASHEHAPMRGSVLVGTSPSSFITVRQVYYHGRQPASYVYMTTYERPHG